MKIPFDIKYRPQIESGEYKVETRDGRTVRVVCWDLDKPQEPIIACVKQFDGNESDETFTINGRYWTTGKTCGEDLFIITPEPELTEFEKRVRFVMTEILSDRYEPGNIDDVKGISKGLLDIARKQIINEAEEKAEKEGYCIEDAVAFDDGFKTAKEIYSKSEAKPSKRLPTIEEWKWLISNCEWKWDDARKGQVVTAKNGNSIFLPAAGFRYVERSYSAGSGGYYWSSSRNTGDPDLAYYVCFNSGDVSWYRGNRCYGRSVRLVSDTPMEGFVDMGNNLFWAEKNVEGLYNYDEAMNLFNS